MSLGNVKISIWEIFEIREDKVKLNWFAHLLLANTLHMILVLFSNTFSHNED